MQKYCIRNISNLSSLHPQSSYISEDKSDVQDYPRNINNLYAKTTTKFKTYDKQNVEDPSGKKKPINTYTEKMLTLHLKQKAYYYIEDF